MTDPTPLSDDELDLAASLAIDGQELLDRSLSDDDRRRVEARMAELRPAVDAVGEPVPVPTAEVRAGHIAAAIAAVAEPDIAAEVDPPRDLRRPRRGRARAVAPWAAAAAAVVLVVAALASLAGRGDSHSAATSATFQPVAGALAENSTITTAASPQTRQYENATGSDALSDLGSVATADALDALVLRTLHSRTTALGAATGTSSPTLATAGSTTTTTAPSSSSGSGVASCAAAAAALRPAVGAVVLQARATLDGRRVVLLVYDTAGSTSASRRLVAFDAASCEVLVDRPL